MAILFQIRNAFKSYGDQVLLDNTDATIIDNVKVGFIGRNGAGKSTLLRVLLGEEELDAGEVIAHPRLRVGYLQATRSVSSRRVGDGFPDAGQ